MPKSQPTPEPEGGKTVRQLLHELDDIVTPLQGRVFVLDTIAEKIDLAAKGKGTMPGAAAQIAADISDGISQIDIWARRLSEAVNAEPAEGSPPPTHERASRRIEDEAWRLVCDMEDLVDEVRTRKALLLCIATSEAADGEPHINPPPITLATAPIAPSAAKRARTYARNLV